MLPGNKWVKKKGACHKEKKNNLKNCSVAKIGTIWAKTTSNDNIAL